MIFINLYLFPIIHVNRLINILCSKPNSVKPLIILYFPGVSPYYYMSSDGDTNESENEWLQFDKS